MPPVPKTLIGRVCSVCDRRCCVVADGMHPRRAHSGQEHEHDYLKQSRYGSLSVFRDSLSLYSAVALAGRHRVPNRRCAFSCDALVAAHRTAGAVVALVRVARRQSFCVRVHTGDLWRQVRCGGTEPARFRRFCRCRAATGARRQTRCDLARGP
eukprot:Amastigsp_a858576_3.p2 type:complete len:154 gc:universal Amastigsp_a858576_3:112-573(+)